MKNKDRNAKNTIVKTMLKNICFSALDIFLKAVTISEN